MKKRSLLLTAALLVALLFVAFSAASAEPNGPIVCSVDMGWNGASWEGTVDGCILTGAITFVPDEANPAVYKSKTLHFFELFTIYPVGGGEIHGTTAGVGHFYPPFQFRANGWVTAAEGGWEYLIGNKYFEMGTSTDPLSPDIPLTVEDMVMRIVPAQRP